MRTSSSPLVYAPLPSTRKPASKRRRLNHVLDPPARALMDNSNVPPAPNTPLLSLYAKLSCSTCHRSLPAAIRPGVAGSSVCSRCTAPTCAICSRTCTSYTRPLSFPPTPALTRSPSPSTHSTTPVSPKRLTLGLNFTAMNCDASVALPPPSAPTTKRKKAPIDKDIDADLDGSDHHDAMLSMLAGLRGGPEPESIVIPGCGRVVCRTCCVESVSNDGKLCVDCFAFV